MRNKRFPNFPDDADYNTNAPSYYEDLARKEKLIRLLAERIWGYEKILDDTLEEIQERFRSWDQNLDDFSDDVKVLLQNWLDDGSLDHIINDTIFNTKADQVDLENVTAQLQQTEQELSSQLAEKANDSEVRKKTVLLTELDLSDTLKQQINGNAPILQTVGDKVVTPIKTTFFNSGKNLFNKSAATPGYFINPADGQLVVNASYQASEFIPVVEGKVYTENFSYYYAWYDSNKAFISGEGNESDPTKPRPLTAPTNASYIRLSVLNSVANQFQFEDGNSATTYEAYHEPFFNTEFIKEKSITREKMDFAIPEQVYTRNLFDKKSATTGHFVSQADGKLYPSTAHNTSDFIKVKQSTSYSLIADGSTRVAYYDGYKNFISGVYPSGSPITTPNNASYVRFSFTSSIDSQQFEEGTTNTELAPYGFTIEGLIDESEKGSSVILNLPSKLYAIVGQEFNIYFDNVVSGKDSDYTFDVACGKGKQFENYFRFVPDVKEVRPLTLTVYKNGEVVASKNTVINVAGESVGNGITKKIMIIGDSTTNSQAFDENMVSRNGMVSRKLHENFSSDVMNIETLGTKGNSPYNHEGRSGWKASDYVTLANLGSDINAFWNPTTSKFDFSYYMANNPTVPDYVVINLGINDMFNYTNDESAETEANNIIARYNTIVNSIKGYSTVIKIGIALTIPPNYSQDAFGKAYGAGQTMLRYKRNNILWVKKLIDTYQSRESENIYLVPIHTNIDTRYNYGLEETQVNARNDLTVLMPIPNGGVHPDTPGYWQIADNYWYWLKSFEV